MKEKQGIHLAQVVDAIKRAKNNVRKKPAAAEKKPCAEKVEPKKKTKTKKAHKKPAQATQKLNDSDFDVQGTKNRKPMQFGKNR